jgi:hypothetical protein
MRKTLILLGCIVIFFTLPAAAQILSPVAHLEGTLDADTKSFFVGKTSISGTFQGFQMDSFQENPLFEEVNIFPLFGSTTFKSLDTIKIIDTDAVPVESLEDIENIEDADGIVFSNVDVVAEKGPFLLATNTGQIHVQSELSYAISSIIDLTLEGSSSLPFLLVATISQMTVQFSGDIAYVMQSSDTGRIMIKDPSGNMVWSGGSTDYIFVLEDEDFTFFQDASLYLFPLISEETLETTTLSVSPAGTAFRDISMLLEDVSDSAVGFGDMSDISENIRGFEAIISTASAVVNGGMILIETDDTFSVDDSSQTFSNMGFARGEKFDVTFSSDTHTPTISGDYRLIFLGDHLYNSQAKESENGVAFPFLLIITWAVAIVLFILFRFYFRIVRPILIKKEIDEKRDEKIKKYAFIFHIAALIVAFILLDREISFQFGVSAIDAVLGQGVSLILLAFVIVELILWVFGFLLLAIPIRIITNSGLRIIGIGKGGKGIGKGVGAFGIWIFCAFYVKLIINLIFLIINPNSLFPMG